MSIRKRSSILRTPSASAVSELDKVVAGLRKQHGASSVVAGSAAVQPWRIPLGVYAFDLATLGGLPHGRISMVHGPKHSGKSLSAMRAVMGAQQTLQGSKAVWIDVEGTYDEVWSSKTGVDNDQLLLCQTDSGEQAVDTAVALTHTKEVGLIVVDSLAALIPIKEQEEDADKALVALQSRLITSMLRKVSQAQITERKRGHYVTVLLLNQQRSKIGGWSPMGDPISLPGGKALGHFTSLEWRMKNKEVVAGDGEGRETLSHNDHAFTIEKNKLNAGMRTGEFRLLRRSDAKSGLTEGDIDDVPFILADARRRGWYDGTPRGGYTLTFGDYEALRADTADDMVATLNGDKEYTWALRNHLIATHAESLGMRPEFVEYLRNGIPPNG